MLLVEVTLEMVRILSPVAANVTLVKWRIFMDVFSVSNELALSLANKVTVLTAETLTVTMSDFMPF